MKTLMNLESVLEQEVFYKTGKRGIKSFRKFESPEAFAGYNAASDYATGLGYRVGNMCSPRPTACGKGFDYIAKWNNISKSEGHLIEAIIVSDDFRNGVIYFVEFL
jgi:hypothetical protein